MSSTWRIDPAGLFSAGHWSVPFMDVCPDMPERPRRDEILSWLAQHKDVSRFVVVDDEDDELDDLPLFQPSSTTGITPEIVDGVSNYLNEKSDKTMRRGWLIRAVQKLRSVLSRK
jgi:hypothetical protein